MKTNDEHKPSLLVLHTQLESNKQKREENQEAIFTPSQWKIVRVISGMVGTALVTLFADKFIGEGNGESFYNGKYAWGFAQALKLSGASITIAPMLNEEWGDVLFKLGLRAPIVAATGILVLHPNAQKLVSYAPLGLGQYLSTFVRKETTNEHSTKVKFESICGPTCQGICDRCYIPKLVVAFGIYKNMIDPFVDKIGGYFGRKLGFIKEEQQTT